MNYRNRSFLDLARDMPCMKCGAQDGTVVMAHSNQQEHGKGMGIKAHDCFTAALCHKCHEQIDSGKAPREAKREEFNGAMHRTWLWLFKQGKVRVA